MNTSFLQIKSSLSVLNLPQLALTAVCFYAASAFSLSLDEVVENQLEGTVGGLPCSRFLDAGGDPHGNLANICSRAVPQQGATPSAGGGGSASASFAPVLGGKLTSDAPDSVDKSSGKWGFFLTAENETSDRDAGLTEGAYDSDINRFILGTTFQPSSSAAYSVALLRSEQDGDFVNGGYFTDESTGLRAMASFSFAEKFQLQVAAVFDDVSAERVRNAQFVETFNGAEIYSVSGSPKVDNDYQQSGLSSRLAYEVNFGKFTLVPQLGLDWLQSDYGTHSESGESGLELTFHNDKKKSLQALLGLQSNAAFGTQWGAFILQFDANWRHEFEDDSRDVAVSFVEDAAAVTFNYQTDELDADFVELSLGGVLVFANGIQAFATVQTLLSHDVYERQVASLGLRVEL